MQCVGRAQALDGCDLFPVMHQGQTKARIHAPAVHMHCTCAALAVVTALLRSGESNGLTEAIQQRRPWVHVKLMVLAVNPQRDRDRALDVRSVRAGRGRDTLLASAVRERWY